MEITNQQIFDIIKPLNRLMIQKIPAKLAYKIAALARELNPINGRINSQRSAIAFRFGASIPKGDKSMVVPKEQSKAASLEIEELMKITQNIAFEPIQIEEFAGAFIEPDIILKGGWIFVS